MLRRFFHDCRRLTWIGLLLGGCSRSGGDIALPEWNPSAAAGQALTTYDSNGDHKLSPDELKKCPGLLASLSRVDRDGDGTISGDELTAKLKEIQDQQAALVEVMCVVTRGGQPLEGATVAFEPESFMGDGFKPAKAITGPDGVAFPTVAEEEIPAEYRGRVHGMHCGVFRVLVTHPHVEIPARYNTQTELGRVVARRDHESLNINF